MSGKTELLRTSAPTDFNPMMPKGNVKEFDPFSVLVLDSWQDYVFLISITFTVVITANRLITADIPGVMVQSTITATVVMGKTYADEAHHKLSLGILAKSLHYQVGHLHHENITLTKLTEEQRSQLSQMSYENNYYASLNSEHRGAVQETKEALTAYKEELVKITTEHRDAVEELKLELEDGNRKKEEVEKDLAQRREELRVETEKLKRVTERLEKATAKAVETLDRV